MATSINSNLNRNSFGTHMPMVFMDKIILNTIKEDESDYPDRLKVTPTLNIKFTKPRHLQAKTAEDMISEYLSNLNLYVFLTFGNEWKVQLESNIFQVEHFLKEWNAGTTFSEYYKEGHDAGFGAYKQISLSELITPASEDTDLSAYNSKLVISNVFDENGEEIIEISNIQVDLGYWSIDASELPEEFAPLAVPGAPHVSDASSVMLFTFIGPSDTTLSAIRSYETTYATRTTYLWNSYYGAISYHHILQNGTIPNKFHQIYTDSAGVRYEKAVLQSTNGRIYKTDLYTFDDIKATLQGVVDEFDNTRSSDATLNTNLMKLEAIFNGSGNKMRAVGELSNYRSVYADKAPGTLSADLYSRLTIAMAEIIETLESQEQLGSNLLYNPLVFDQRDGGGYTLLKPPYVYPHGGGGDLEDYDGISATDIVKGTPPTSIATLGSPSDCFIPRKWVNLGRNAYMSLNVPNLDSSVDWKGLEHYYGDIATDSSFATRLTANVPFDPYDDEFTTLLDDLAEIYESTGLSGTMAEEMALEEAETLFSGEAGIDYRDEIVALHKDLLNLDSGAGDYVTIRDGQAVVRNSGYFIFDYEKAVRTQSKISKIFNLKQLERYFGFSIPYREFWVEKVKLARKEVNISEDFADLDDSRKYIKPSIELSMKPCITSAEGDTLNDLPMDDISDIRYEGGLELASDIDYYLDRLKYMNPYMFLGDSSSSPSVYFSILSFSNFDVLNGNPARRLAGLNTGFLSEEGWSDSTSRFMDGYRTMMFRFYDAMDDDVAYLNTIDPDMHSDRVDAITAGNARGEQSTCYETTVITKDTTEVVYQNFVNFVTEVYNAFVPYASDAAEICAWNNITNEYNEYFADQIEEAYPDSPWIRAAYTCVGLSNLIFSESVQDSSNYYERVLELIMAISPKHGSLKGTQRFLEEFNGLMQYIRTMGEDLGLGPTSDEITPRTRYLSLLGEAGGDRKTFYNEFPITQLITGDFIVDSTASPIEVGDLVVAPIPLIMDDSALDALSGTETLFASMTFTTWNGPTYFDSPDTGPSLGLSDGSPDSGTNMVKVFATEDDSRHIIKASYDQIFTTTGPNDWRTWLFGIAHSLGGIHQVTGDELAAAEAGTADIIKDWWNWLAKITLSEEQYFAELSKRGGFSGLTHLGSGSPGDDDAVAAGGEWVPGEDSPIFLDPDSIPSDVDMDEYTWFIYNESGIRGGVFADYVTHLWSQQYTTNTDAPGSLTEVNNNYRTVNYMCMILNQIIAKSTVDLEFVDGTGAVGEVRYVDRDSTDHRRIAQILWLFDTVYIPENQRRIDLAESSQTVHDHATRILLDNHISSDFFPDPGGDRSRKRMLAYSNHIVKHLLQFMRSYLLILLEFDDSGPMTSAFDAMRDLFSTIASADAPGGGFVELAGEGYGDTTIIERTISGYDASMALTYGGDVSTAFGDAAKGYLFTAYTTMAGGFGGSEFPHGGIDRFGVRERVVADDALRDVEYSLEDPSSYILPMGFTGWY